MSETFKYIKHVFMINLFIKRYNYLIYFVIFIVLLKCGEKKITYFLTISIIIQSMKNVFLYVFKNNI